MPRRFYEIFLSLRNRHLMVIDLAYFCVVPVIYTALSLVWKRSILYPIRLLSSTIS